MKYCSVIIFILFIIPFVLCNDSSSLLVPDSEDNDDDNQKGMFNFASHAAGAVILDKSPSSSKGFSNLLNDDKDKYAIASCSEKKWVVIGLSEDILVKTVVVANYEKYSSQLKNFQLLASTSFPTDQWINLGTYQAEPRLGEQVFEVSNSSSHTRYLKFKFMTHYDDEALCTLSQIKVHGTTVIASFQEEVKISEATMRDMLSQLNLDETIQKTDEKNESDTTISSTQSIQETEKQQIVPLQGNDGAVTETSNDTVTIESNSTNDSADQSITNEQNDEVVVIVGENETSVVDNNIENATIKTDVDIVLTNTSSETPVDDVSQAPGIDSVDVGSTTEEERINTVSSNSTIDEIKVAATATATSDEAISNTEVEYAPLDDKVDEAIPDQLPVDAISSDNETGEGPTQEDKGPSLMQTIAESTVHAVKEIVLAPLRQIPKPKIGKHQTGSGRLNEVQENLFGISSSSKTDDESIEHVVTPDKLVTDIKNIDKHHNRPQVTNISEQDRSISSRESNDTVVTTEVVDNDTTTEDIDSSQPETILHENVEKNTTDMKGITSTSNDEQAISTEVENLTKSPTETSSPLQSNDSTTDSSSKNISSSTALIETIDNSTHTITSIVENEVVAVNEEQYDTDKAANTSTADAVNVTILDNVIVSNLTTPSDIDNDSNVNATVPLISSVIVSNATSNITNGNNTVTFDAIDKAVMIIDNKSNESVLTNTKKIPILQPTASRASSSPPLPANCLDNLKFADFQAKMIAKLVNSSDDKDRSVPLTSQDNVFRHLMQKIKMLEMNYAIIEMYSIQIGDCYRTVLGDLANNVTTSLQVATDAASSATISADILTNISYHRPVKYDNLKLTGGNGIINKNRDKVLIDGLENILLRYNEDDIIQLIAVALILGLLSLFVSCAIGLFAFLQLRKHYNK